MKSLTFYLIIIIIVLGGLAYTFYELNKQNKEAYKRWEQNFTQNEKDIQQDGVFNWKTIKRLKKEHHQGTANHPEYAALD